MKDRKILVLGMARSGIAVAEALARLGAHVRISDIKSAAELGGALDALKLPQVEWRLGEPAETLLEGMDTLLISPGVPVSHPAVRKARKMGIEVTGELEMAWRLGQGYVVAITGTNGKTTTTMLTGEIFKNAGKVAHVVGNIGYPYSAVSLNSRKEDVIVCEVSSFQLETVRDFHPNISAILNITEDHLNRHGTMDNYVAHKARIFANQAKGDTLVLNFDDARLREMAAMAHCGVSWFSRTQTVEKGAFVRDGSIVYGTAEECRAICPVAEVGIPGPHNLENALAATAIAMAADVPAPVVRHTLRTFKGVEHRIEFVRALDGVNYINDSKGTNVDSTLKAVATMDRPTVLILGGYDKQVDMSPLCRALPGSMIKKVVLIGDTAHKLAAWLDEAGYGEYTHAGYDFKKAIETARALAGPGDNVLLSPACASFDMFDDFEARGREFKRIVHALEDKGA